jgi:hypothetical protein
MIRKGVVLCDRPNGARLEQKLGNGMGFSRTSNGGASKVFSRNLLLEGLNPQAKAKQDVRIYNDGRQDGCLRVSTSITFDDLDPSVAASLPSEFPGIIDPERATTIPFAKGQTLASRWIMLECAEGPGQYVLPADEHARLILDSANRLIDGITKAWA